MNIFKNFSTTPLAILFAATILFAGCNNPASNDDDDHDDHTIPFGIEFIMNGETIVTFFNGDVEGHFDVQSGDQTSLITAEFLDEDGNEIHAEDFDDEYFLDWNIGNADLVEVEQHDDDGRFSFHLVGKNAGETTIQFLLMHGADHDEIRTPAVNENDAIEVFITE